jgi:4-alpha-glucanotransferase
MSDDTLRQLATEAGLASHWKDAFGKQQDVSAETLRTVLAALGLPAGNDDAIAGSLDRLRSDTGLPPLLTADAGGTIEVPARAGRYLVKLEDGRTFEGMAGQAPGGATVRAPDEAGYHRLEIDGEECILATAPARCFSLPGALAAAGKQPGRAWGLAAQLYSLRRAGDGGLGDYGGLTELVRAAARHGADAVSISPVHAQFSADPDRFSPYAPSSRVAGNVLHAAVDLSGPDADGLEAADLVDWPRVARLRLAALRTEFDTALETDRLSEFDRWRADADEGIELHARFEALHQHQFAGGTGPWNWHDWPQALHDSGSEAVAAFARAHEREVTFHAWLQYRAESGLRAAQQAALDAGMAVGLITDLAVGADLGGSQCWSRQDESLTGLTIGAPPDLLSRDGQNWGITAFSPRGLRRHGFRAFVEMLRTSLRFAGGMRVDHAMGLNRLWVVPDGERSALGTYLTMPETDMLRLVRLESNRHKAIVLGEDLGTVPEGFTDRLQAQGLDGMRVLWFEKDDDTHFRSPSRWTQGASAMTSTHDLATVSGWWRGRDIDWNEKLARTDDIPAARAERAEERGRLWQAMRDSGAASGEAPGEWNGWEIVDAAVTHVGVSACELVMLPLEDALALEEAPNLPGTTDEHPNWRRRLPGHAATMLDEPHVAERLDRLRRARAGA